MSGLAVVLVLSAAVLHATWNFFAKRAYGGAPFVWLYGVTATLIYAPLIVWLFLTTHLVLNGVQIIFLLGDSILQVIYFLLLTRGYQVADLSLVYPLARGTGPLLSTFGAIVLIGERPSLLALTGALLIGGGIIVLTGDPRKWRQPSAQPGIIYALLTGMVIATYTLWDRQALAVYGVPPLLLDWTGSAGNVVLLLPLVTRRWPDVWREWHDHRGLVIGVAVLAPLAYLLVLTALSFSPVSYVAPMRESSVLIGTLLGSRLLAEGQGKRRALGAAVIACGVIAIGLG